MIHNLILDVSIVLTSNQINPGCLTSLSLPGFSQYSTTERMYDLMLADGRVWFTSIKGALNL